MNAKQRIYIQTPYFLPTEGLLRALQAAALAHVDVRVMIPRHSDSVMMNLASASYLAECMRAGIKIYFYEHGMLHSKMMLIDDEFCTIGSTNFDFRSFEHNFEANLFFYSRQFNNRITEIFKTDFMHCSRIKPSEWRMRPIWRKAAESIVRLLSPIL
jgi:cardiolipin synthase